MRIILALAAASIALVAPSMAIAAEAWTGAVKVVTLYPSAAGLTFYVDGPALKPTGSPCEVNRIILPMSQANYEAIVSAIYLSFASNLPIQVNYDTGTLGQCEIVANRVIVSRS